MPHVWLRGNQIGYTDTGGDGVPVLLVHAFPLNSKMWQGQIEALGNRYRLIVPDLSGFGESDAPEDTSAYSVDEWADELNALLEELGIAKVVLVGLSMGGYIAFAFLRKYRDKVAALVLADTRAEADPPEGVERRSAQQEMVRNEGTSGLIDALTTALLGESTRTNRPDVIDTVKEVMDNPAAGFIGALEAMKNRPDSTAELTAIDVPTLIIVGENDGITPPEASRKMHEHIGGSRLVVVPDAGHLSSLEAPDTFNGALAEFLAAL